MLLLTQIFLPFVKKNVSSEGLAADRLSSECKSSTFSRKGLQTVQIRNYILPSKVIHYLSIWVHGTPSETIVTCLVCLNLYNKFSKCVLSRKRFCSV